MAVGPDGYLDPGVDEAVEERGRRVEPTVVVESPTGVDLRHGPRVAERVGDRSVVVLGREPAEVGVALDQVRMRGDREQLRLDERDELLDVAVDQRPPPRLRLAGALPAGVAVGAAGRTRKCPPWGIESVCRRRSS